MLQRHIAPARRPRRTSRPGPTERGDDVVPVTTPVVDAPATDTDADEAALTALYRTHASRVYRYLYSRLGNRLDAEDLTGQVFLAAVDALVSGSRPRQPAAWLLTIARRRLADHYRRRRPTEAIEAAADVVANGADPLHEVIVEEDLKRLREVLAELPEADVELLRLRFAAGLTYGEMAEVLGKADGAVKMAVHRLIRCMALDWEVVDARTH